MAKVRFLDEMTPGEEAIYLARQPKAIQAEIGRLRQENEALADQVEALITAVESPQDAPITWRVIGAQPPANAIRVIPAGAAVTFRLGGDRVLDVRERNGSLRVSVLYSGEVGISPVARNAVDLSVTGARIEKEQYRAGMTLLGAASLLADQVNDAEPRFPAAVATVREAIAHYLAAYGLAYAPKGDQDAET